MVTVLAEGVKPTEGVTATVNLAEDVGRRLALEGGELATELMPAVSNPPTVAAPVEGVTPTVGVSVAGRVDPAVDLTPTEEVPRPVGASPADRFRAPQSNYGLTVGVSPTVRPPERVRTPGQWIDAAGITYEAKRVQRVQMAQHAMTLGEERFYQAVWNAKDADGVFGESPRSKTFSLGYDRLSHLVRLDEKSVRQLVPKLIAKKILEVLAREDSAARIGRTYRIFSCEGILERQRAADLHFIAKRGRAVEFVTTKSAGVTASVGVTLTEGV